MTLKQFIRTAPDKLILDLVHGTEVVNSDSYFRLIILVVEDIKIYETFGDIRFAKKFPKAREDWGLIDGLRITTIVRASLSEPTLETYDKQFILPIPSMDVKKGELVLLGAFPGDTEIEYLHG